VPQLRFLDNEGLLRSIPLIGKEVTIGRASQCEIPLVDDLASREHARIKPVGDATWQVQDLESRNRTYVNNQAIKSRVLQPGDVVRVGGRLIEYVDDSDEAPVQAADVFLADREPPEGCTWMRLNQPVSLGGDQLKVLALVIDSIPRVESLDIMATTLLEQVATRLRADRGFVAIRDKSGKGLEFLATHAMSKHVPGKSMVPVSQAFVQRCQKQNSIGCYPEANGDRVVTEDYPPSALVVPLVDAKRVQGVIYLDRLTAKEGFTPAEAGWLAAAGAQFSGLWIGMQQRAVRHQQQETTLRMTQLRQLQRGINAVEEITAGPLRLACRRLAGRERCGDLYHLASLDDKRLAVLLADAGGTGPGGFAQALAVLTALRAHLGAGSGERKTDLGAAFEAIHRTLLARPVCQPVPVLAILIDLGEGRLTYVNAGYTMPILLTGPARLVTLDHSSLLLGIEGKNTYREASVDLSAKFRVFACSDGVIDAWDKSGQCFAVEKVRAGLLEEDAFAEPEAMIDRVVAALTAFRGDTPLSDDALLVAVARD